MHDKPGKYKLINLRFEDPPLKSLEKEFDDAEDQGYKFLAINERFAVFYKEL